MVNKPTPRQLHYLKQLAESTGQTFTYPRHLRRGKPGDRPDEDHPGPREPCRAADRARRSPTDFATGSEDSARVRDDEISGRGQVGYVARNRRRDAEPTSDRPAPKRTTPVVGKRTRLGRYIVSEGERIVHGQRVDAVVEADRRSRHGGWPRVPH